jgi:hypothetical protein
VTGLGAALRHRDGHDFMRFQTVVSDAICQTAHPLNAMFGETHKIMTVPFLALFHRQLVDALPVFNAVTLGNHAHETVATSISQVTFRGRFRAIDRSIPANYKNSASSDSARFSLGPFPASARLMTGSAPGKNQHNVEKGGFS